MLECLNAYGVDNTASFIMMLLCECCREHMRAAPFTAWMHQEKWETENSYSNSQMHGLFRKKESWERRSYWNKRDEDFYASLRNLEADVDIFNWLIRTTAFFLLIGSFLTSIFHLQIATLTSDI